MPKVLFVDDEPAILDGYQRLLRREFEIEVAVGGELGLVALRERGPFAVVVSDMRMPGMSGAQFLAAAREVCPDTVRMLLTGYTDLDAAMSAVNEGNIFRFLTKPCDRERLTQALTAGCVQHELVVGRKELLEKTLAGSIRVMTDVLSAANPEVFGRSMQIVRYVRHLVKKFPLTQAWEVETAAVLSQLGCVTLDAELLRAAYGSGAMEAEEQRRFMTHPEAAKVILAKIPRLEAVAWMIGEQMTRGPLVPPVEVLNHAEAVTGARILRLAVAIAELRRKEHTDAEAVELLRLRGQDFEAAMLGALGDLEPEDTKMELRTVAVTKLAVGMVLDQEIRNTSGALLVGRGQEVTSALAMRLENFCRMGTIHKEVQALVPVQ